MTKPCSLCGKPRRAEFRAFCSATCRDRDLLAWGSDAYIMGENPDMGADDLFSEGHSENP